MRDRRRKLGLDMYRLLGITKGDTDGILAALKRNYSFFDAGRHHHHRDKAGDRNFFHVGSFLQTFCLLACERDLSASEAWSRSTRPSPASSASTASARRSGAASPSAEDPSKPVNRLVTDRAPWRSSPCFSTRRARIPMISPNTQRCCFVHFDLAYSTATTAASAVATSALALPSPARARQTCGRRRWPLAANHAVGPSARSGRRRAALCRIGRVVAAVALEPAPCCRGPGGGSAGRCAAGSRGRCTACRSPRSAPPQSPGPVAARASRGRPSCASSARRHCRRLANVGGRNTSS